MMMRALFLLLGSLFAAAAAVAAPGDDKVRTELVSEYPTLVRGQPNWFAVSVTPEKGWHTYWLNPGDAGLVTKQKWTLPDGVSVSEQQWPYPHAYREGPLMTYGFGKEHILLTAIEVPADHAADELAVAVELSWLVCKDICIPGKATLEGRFAVGESGGAPRDPALFSRARARIPVPAETWGGAWEPSQDGLRAEFEVPDEILADAQRLEYFVLAESLIDHAAPARWARSAKGLVWEAPQSPEFLDWPETLDGVLVVHAEGGAQAYELSVPRGAVATATTAWDGEASAPAGEAGPGLLLAMAFAFLGGLILNLMPCVFPVLALKALSLTTSSDAHHRRTESLVYTAGVVLSFLLIAGALLALRAGGAALGWGFQLQNPVLVGLLAWLMFVVALGLAGWTDIGMSWMGLGQDRVPQDGHKGAFFTGVLAVVVASPCTAPFMGAALGYAVTQPAPVALAIFTALGLGMAVPFVLIAWVPAIARRLPKPGRWMDLTKRVMAIPMFAAALWLFWVMWRQAGTPALLLALAGAGALAVAVRRTPQGRWIPAPAATALAVLALGVFAWPGFHSRDARVHVDAEWQPWSTQAVAEAREAGRPVFVDFTADWCISCLVNKRTALSDSAVREAFARDNFLLLKADWTNYDPAITAALAEFGRNGVPLYLVYPDSGEPARVLPQLLTASIVLDALQD